MPINVPQKPFYSTQDILSTDIELYYNKIVKEIDLFRSQFNAMSSNITQSISVEDLDSLFVNNDSNSIVAQESRCNAFYRMMGFPVVAADYSGLYSPGFDPDGNKDPVQITKKLAIANSLLKKLKPILDRREFYSKNILNYFQSQDVNSCALALASVSARSFADQFKTDIDPLDIDSQLSTIPSRSIIEFKFQDQLNEATLGKLTNSEHILKPFIVDPRIELTVTPATSRICVPFLMDKSKSQLTKGNYLRRPYIERVIRARFNKQNQLVQDADKIAINKYTNDLIDFAKSNTDITDATIVDNLSNSLKSLYKSELANITKLLKVAEAFTSILLNAQIKIEKIQTQINWKPIPSIRGPEFGSTISDIDNHDKDNNQQIDLDIILLQIKKITGNTDFDAGSSDPDLGNFVFSGIDDTVLDGAKNNVESYDKQLNTLNKRRDEWGNQANQLLRTIEIIMGEFSGLGLMDIIAIQTALWSISPGALLGLIDSYAIGRMQLDNSLKTDIVALSPSDALKEFEKSLKQIYTLIGSFYTNLQESDKKSQ